MRRIMMLFCLLTVMLSCNIMPKECEQVSDIIGDVPELNKNEYNDCELVNQNYMYFAKWMDDSYMEHYPATEYLSQEGDTVMIKGFLSHGYGDTMSYHKGNWICHLHSDSLLWILNIIHVMLQYLLTIRNYSAVSISQENVMR